MIKQERKIFALTALRLDEAGHSKATCPKLVVGGSSNGAKKDGKSSRQLHTIQTLTLSSAEFIEVTVGHTDSTHACCVTQTMWQPSVGPHDLVCLYGTIGDHRVTIMIDDGATHNFLNYALVKRLRLPETKSDHKYTVSLANGHDKTSLGYCGLGGTFGYARL